MKRTKYKVVFKSVNSVFKEISSSEKPLAVRNVKWKIWCLVTSTPINLNPDPVRYNSFMASLERYDGSCNTHDDLSNRLCVLNKTQNLNIKRHNITVERNEL